MLSSGRDMLVAIINLAVVPEDQAIDTPAESWVDIFAELLS